MDKNVVIEVVSGVEGHCVTLNNYRVAGQKPWGGGQVVHSFQTKQSQIDIALRRAKPENDCPAHYDKSGCAMNSGFCIGEECSSYADAGKPKNEPLTNAQRIRGMTDEELAEFLWEQNGSNRYWKSVGKYLDWLQQPAETEGTE